MTVGKQRDGALVARLAGIGVEPFMQGRRSRHGIEQNHNAGGEYCHQRPNPSAQIVLWISQIKVKLAQEWPRASANPDPLH